MCSQRKNRTHKMQLLPTRRLKIWEIKHSFHCTILGTCLTMEELRKLMRQSGVVLEKKPSDYDLHATMVGQVESKGRTSRNINRMLDRKYKRWIQALSRCKEEKELRHHWLEARESGEIAGIFWVIMTHPHAGPELIRQAYEDVHMLSHLQGASNRADLRRIKALEQEVTALQETLRKTQQNHHVKITRREDLIRQQEQDLAKVMMETSQPALQSDCGVPSEELQKQNQTLARRLDWAESQLAERDMRIDNLQDEMAGLKELVHEAREEHAAMEQTLIMQLAANNQTDGDHNWRIDLEGKRVLYVGGRATLTPHLRSLVESNNGRFEHHDGGLEDNRAGLQCTLAGADMVFCPIDCVSHDACKRVKRHCQQQAKQFIPLRSSGLSAFAAGLQQFSIQASKGIDSLANGKQERMN